MSPQSTTNAFRHLLKTTCMKALLTGLLSDVNHKTKVLKILNLYLPRQFVSGDDTPTCWCPHLLIQTSVLLLLWTSGFSPILSWPLSPSHGSSLHFLQHIRFTLPTCSCVFSPYLSFFVSVCLSLSLQDSSSSVGSGEFTGIKELDDISQEIAQLQR